MSAIPTCTGISFASAGLRRESGLLKGQVPAASLCVRAIAPARARATVNARDENHLDERVRLVLRVVGTRNAHQEVIMRGVVKLSFVVAVVLSVGVPARDVDAAKPPLCPSGRFAVTDAQLVAQGLDQIVLENKTSTIG